MFIDDSVRYVSAVPVDVDAFGAGALVGSLYEGAPGVAYFLYEAYRLSGDEALLQRAREWLAAGASWSRREASPLANSLLFGRAGGAFVAALVAHARNDAACVASSVRAFAHAWRDVRKLKPVPTELFAGAAGFLAAAPALMTPTLPRVLVDLLSTVGREAAHYVLRKVRMARDTDTQLGFAHGLAGELWALAHEGHSDEVAAPWQQLDAAAERNERYVLWPAHRDASIASDRAATLCNGVTGQALLCEALAAGGHTTARRRWLTASNTVFKLSSESLGLCRPVPEFDRTRSWDVSVLLRRISTTRLTPRRTRARINGTRSVRGRIAQERLRGQLLNDYDGRSYAARR
jgi:hypothetical protein